MPKSASRRRQGLACSSMQCHQAFLACSDAKQSPAPTGNTWYQPTQIGISRPKQWQGPVQAGIRRYQHVLSGQSKWASQACPTNAMARSCPGRNQPGSACIVRPVNMGFLSLSVRCNGKVLRQQESTCSQNGHLKTGHVCGPRQALRNTESTCMASEELYP